MIINAYFGFGHVYLINRLTKSPRFTKTRILGHNAKVLSILFPQFAIVESVVTPLKDEYPFLDNHKTSLALALCVFMFVVGLPMTTQVILEEYFQQKQTHGTEGGAIEIPRQHRG